MWEFVQQCVTLHPLYIEHDYEGGLSITPIILTLLLGYIGQLEVFTMRFLSRHGISYHLIMVKYNYTNIILSSVYIDGFDRKFF